MMNHGLRRFIDVECAEISDIAVYRLADLLAGGVSGNQTQSGSNRGSTAGSHQLRRHAAGSVVSDPPDRFIPVRIIDAAIPILALATDQSPNADETVPRC